MTTNRDHIISLAKECKIYHRDTPKGTEEMWCWETDLIAFYLAAQREAFEQAYQVVEYMDDVSCVECAEKIRNLKEWTK